MTVINDANSKASNRNRRPWILGRVRILLSTKPPEGLADVARRPLSCQLSLWWLQVPTQGSSRKMRNEKGANRTRQSTPPPHHTHTHTQTLSFFVVRPKAFTGFNKRRHRSKFSPVFLLIHLVQPTSTRTASRRPPISRCLAAGHDADSYTSIDLGNIPRPAPQQDFAKMERVLNSRIEI